MVGVELVDLDAAVHLEPPLAQGPHRRHRHPVLVVDLPHDHLDEVLERDEALQRAVLVDDQGQVDPLGPHLLEESDGGLTRGDGKGRTDEARERGLGTCECRVVHVPGVDEPEDVVELTLEDRVARVAGLPDDAHRLARCRLGRQSGYAGSRGHDLAHIPLVELHCTATILLHDACRPASSAIAFRSSAAKRHRIGPF
jgi:hypothetical protein